MYGKELEEAINQQQILKEFCSGIYCLKNLPKVGKLHTLYVFVLQFYILKTKKLAIFGP